MRSRRILRFDGWRLPLAPLIILLPALMIGILSMHVWIDGHETSADSTGHSIPVESAATTQAAGSHSLPAAGHLPSPNTAVPEPGPGFDGKCGHGCGSMGAAMASCMLALVLLTLTLLLPPTAVPLPRHLAVWRVQPLLSWTSATARTPSLVQLSISRT